MRWVLCSRLEELVEEFSSTDGKIYLTVRMEPTTDSAFGHATTIKLFDIEPPKETAA